MITTFIWTATLTSVHCLGIGIRTGKLDVHEINLELLVCLDTNQKWRTTASGDDFVGEMDRLEDKGERTLEFPEDSLDQCRERKTLFGLRVPNIFGKNSDGLSVGF